MQKKMIIFCAAIVLLCSIGVCGAVEKQKVHHKADQWIDESVIVLNAASAWFEIKNDLQVQRKQRLIDIFIEKVEYAYQCD